MSLSVKGASQLLTETKTRAIWGDLSPQWILRILAMVNVASGVYRINNVVKKVDVRGEFEGGKIPVNSADFEFTLQEQELKAIQTILSIPTSISDIYNEPHDQIKEQQRLAIEALKEKQESNLFHSLDFGLLKSKLAMRKQAEGVSADQIAQMLDAEGIAIRTGHHCAQPTLEHFGLDQLLRASLACYNTFDVVDAFVRVLQNAKSKNQ